MSPRAVAASKLVTAGDCDVRHENRASSIVTRIVSEYRDIKLFKITDPKRVGGNPPLDLILHAICLPIKTYPNPRTQPKVNLKHQPQIPTGRLGVAVGFYLELGYGFLS